MDKKINARKKAQRLARQRKMRNRRIALTICLVLAVSLISIGGTIAWLTAQSGTVTNTFTVGDITITLDEAKLDGTGRTTEGNTGYKIYPGASIAKDPTVTVEANSEECYVFACVDNGILLENETVSTVATPAIGSNWVKVGAKDTKTVYVYTVDGKPAIVNTLTEAKKLPAVFTSVNIANTVTKSNITQLKDDTISIQAYAHQSNATTPDVAITNAITFFGVTAATA